MNEELKKVWSNLKNASNEIAVAMAGIDKLMKASGNSVSHEITDPEAVLDGIPLDQMSRPQLLTRARQLGYSEEDLRGKHIASLRELVQAKEDVAAAEEEPEVAAPAKKKLVFKKR